MNFKSRTENIFLRSLMADAADYEFVTADTDSTLTFPKIGVFWVLGKVSTGKGL